VLQGLLIVVLLITIGINIMFILDTSRRLHDEVQTTGEKIVSGAPKRRFVLTFAVTGLYPCRLVDWLFN
jgi:hypothetical protein